MGVARFGAIFAFAAFVLLLLATISTPIINDIKFLSADINGSTLRLGTYGFCSGNLCSNKSFGYSIDDVLDAVTGQNQEVRGNVLRGLTKAIGVLNPAAAGFAGLAFLFALGGHVVSHILGSIVAFFAFIVSVVALGVDLGVFIDARHRINDNYAGSPASLGNAMWMVLAGCVALLIAAFTICCGGIRDRRAKNYDSSYNAAPVTAERPGRFNFFRRNNRY